MVALGTNAKKKNAAPVAKAVKDAAAKASEGVQLTEEEKAVFGTRSGANVEVTLLRPVVSGSSDKKTRKDASGTKIVINGHRCIGYQLMALRDVDFPDFGNITSKNSATAMGISGPGIFRQEKMNQNGVPTTHRHPGEVFYATMAELAAYARNDAIGGLVACDPNNVPEGFRFGFKVTYTFGAGNASKKGAAVAGDDFVNVGLTLLDQTGQSHGVSANFNAVENEIFGGLNVSPDPDKLELVPYDESNMDDNTRGLDKFAAIFVKSSVRSGGAGGKKAAGRTPQSDWAKNKAAAAAFMQALTGASNAQE